MLGRKLHAAAGRTRPSKSRAAESDSGRQEARWLREADRHQVWRKLGFSTALEYLEDVFGYAPRTAMERMRVANELGKLPQLEAELASGAVPYSAAKELSRVMTPETEAEWLAGARGKNLRDIEEMVAGRKKGDSPDAPPDPDLIVHDVRLKLPGRCGSRCGPLSRRSAMATSKTTRSWKW